MKAFKLILMAVFIGLLYFGCDDRYIDYDHYADEYHVEDFDSTYLLSEAATTGKRTVFLNIHCTATRDGQDLKGEWFLDFFKNDRGWGKPGYNEIVELDGTRFIAVPYNLDGYTTWDEVSYGVRGANSVSINIAYVGGVDRYLNPKDTRTLAQIRALDEIVHEIKCAMPDVIVMGHRDHDNVPKACPSFSVPNDYGKLNPVFNSTEEFDYNPDEDYRVDSLQ